VGECDDRRDQFRGHVYRNVPDRPCGPEGFDDVRIRGHGDFTGGGGGGNPHAGLGYGCFTWSAVLRCLFCHWDRYGNLGGDVRNLPDSNSWARHGNRYRFPLVWDAAGYAHFSIARESVDRSWRISFLCCNLHRRQPFCEIESSGDKGKKP
jgi:hypothetical protein